MASIQDVASSAAHGLLADTTPALLDVRAVARLLDCSTRHVYRLTDSDGMPTPVRLGALVRWNRNEIERWISAGCPRQG